MAHGEERTPGQQGFQRAYDEVGRPVMAGGEMVLEEAGLFMAGGVASKLLGPVVRFFGFGSQVAFKTEHYGSRLTEAGLNVNQVERAVRAEVNAMRSNMVVNADVVGRMTIDRVQIEYRARLLPNRTVNVGTIFPVK